MRAAGQMTIFDLMAARDPVAEAAAAVDAAGLDPSRAAVFARRIFREFGAEEARRRVSLLGLVFGGGDAFRGVTVAQLGFFDRDATCAEIEGRCAEIVGRFERGAAAARKAAGNTEEQE